jgi:hypothetical protein
MNSIQGELIALDTNQFIFALRQEPLYPACKIILWEKLPQLKIYLPLQVLMELERNLMMTEMRSLLVILNQAKS